MSLNVVNSALPLVLCGFEFTMCHFLLVITNAGVVQRSPATHDAPNSITDNPVVFVVVESSGDLRRRKAELLLTR